MKVSFKKKHSVDSLFMLLLFGFFVLFLLLLLLFSARAYQAAVDGTKENNQLRTAMSYITTKVHQHDSASDVFSGEVEELPALCLQDKIGEKDYITYIFLDGSNLKELFASADTRPTRQLGTSFCDMTSFTISETLDGLYKLSLTDTSGHSGDLFLHPGTSKGGNS